MQVATNQKLVRNRVKLGTALHLSALAILAISLFLTPRSDAPDAMVASFVALGAGILLYAFGQTQTRRWGPRRPQQQALEEAISDLDDRYKLYAFLSSRLPDFILVGPGGVQVLVARADDGQIVCERDVWRRPGRNRLLAPFRAPFVNPTAEAEDGTKKVEGLLREAALVDVPVSAIVVFTHPKVTLRVSGSGLVISRLRSLKETLLRLAGKGKNVTLSAPRIREVRDLLDKRMQQAGSWR